MAQVEKSLQLFERQQCILTTDVVLAGCLWTLMGRNNKVTKNDLIAVVGNLFRELNVRFENDEVIWYSLSVCRNTDSDFADALVKHKSLKSVFYGQ